MTQRTRIRSPHVAYDDPDELGTLRAELKRHVATTLQRVNEEISRYPAPIARCDEHLTALLEQRAVLAQRAACLDDAACAADYIEAYLDSPADPNDREEQALRSRLREQLARLLV